VTTTERLTPAPDGPAPGDQGPPSILGPEHRALTIGIVATILVVAFEAMAVATAMPVAVRDLDGLSLYAWGFSAFMVTSLVGMVVSGVVSDRRSPLVPHVVSGVTLAAGLVVAGTAPTMAVFIAGRALQGVGAGLSIVAIYVVVARTYPSSMRPRIFSAISSAWVMPALIGPAVAGWAAELFSWRVVFLGVLPLIVPAMTLVVLAMRGREGLTTAASAEPAERGWLGRAGRVRTLLALTTAAGAAMLQVAGQRIGEDGAAVAPTAALAVVGAVLLGAALPRLLPRGTLRAARGLPSTILMRGVIAGAFFAAEAFVPLMLVNERSLSPGMAGLPLTAGAIGWALGSWYQGRPATTVPRWRIVQVGCFLVAFGVSGLCLAVPATLPPYLGGALWAVAGLGMGLAMSSISVLMLELSPPAEQGANSAGLQVSEAVNSVVLIGTAGALFAALHVAPGRDGGTFVTIYLLMAAVAAFGALVVAPRLRVAEASPSRRVSLSRR
jgi:MFS family permease